MWMVRMHDAVYNSCGVCLVLTSPSVLWLWPNRLRERSLGEIAVAIRTVKSKISTEARSHGGSRVRVYRPVYVCMGV